MQVSYTQIPMLTSEHVTRFHPNMLPPPSDLKSKEPLSLNSKHCSLLHLAPDGMYCASHEVHNCVNAPPGKLSTLGLNVYILCQHQTLL